MPSYDFECEKCGSQRQVTKSIKDETRSECCCGFLMRQRITGGQFTLFKGGGWASQEIRRADDDRKVRELSAEARRMKLSGAVAAGEQITFEDLGRRVI